MPKNHAGNFHSGITRMLSAMFLVGCSQPVTALPNPPQPEPEKAHSLPPFVVVATRTPQPLNQVSPSVSLITEEEIALRQLQTLEDALKTLPGLTLATTGQRGSQTSLYTRGTENNHTVLLLDGRKLNGGFSGTYNLAQLSLDNLQSIEILRGASSTLYGAEGLGGVVNLVSRQGPRRDKPELVVGMEGGSFASYRASLNTAVGDDLWNISLGSSYFETDNQGPNSEYWIANVMPRLGYRLRDNIFLDMVGFYYDSRLGTPGDQNSLAFPALDDFQENESWLLSPGLTFALSDTLTSRVFYSHSKDRLEARTTTTFVFLDNSNDSPITITTVDHLDFRTKTDQVDLQVDWISPTDLTFTLGTVYLNEDFIQHDLQLGGRPFDNSWNSISAYGQMQWQPREDLLLTAGVRFDDYSDFESPTTWNVWLSRELAAINLRLFINYATAYAIPQALELYHPVFGNPNLEAEESEAWEVGFKQNLWDNSLHWGMVYFNNKIENLITGFLLPENVGRAVTEGVELTVDYRPFPWLNIYGNYTYLTAENRDTGTRLERRPRHQFAVGMNATYPSKLSAGLELRYIKDREDSAFPQDSESGDFTTVLIEEDYTVARFYARYRLNPKMELFGRVENLFNEQYDAVAGFKAPDLAAYGGIRLFLE